MVKQSRSFDYLLYVLFSVLHIRMFYSYPYTGNSDPNPEAVIALIPENRSDSIVVFLKLILDMDRSMKNQQNDMCAQQRLRSTWASTQSDQSSLCALWVANDPVLLQADSEA